MNGPAFVSPSAPPIVIEGQTAMELPPPPAADAAPDTVSLHCTEAGCNEVFVGAPGGPGGAPMQLGRHRWSVHGISKKGQRQARKADPAPPTPVEPERHAVVTTLHETAKTVTGRGAPKGDQLAGVLGTGLSLLTTVSAGWAVDSDPLIRQASETDPQTAAQHKAALQAQLSLSAESAKKIMAPFGRMLAPSALNQKYGRQLVENSDLGPALAELIDLGRSWGQFLSIRREHVALLRQQVQQDPAPAAVPYPTGDVPVTAPAPPAPSADPVLGGGRVATPTYRTQ